MRIFRPLPWHGSFARDFLRRAPLRTLTAQATGGARPHTMSTTAAERIQPARTWSAGNGHPKVSVVIPCLNEAENIEVCVRTALQVLEDNRIPGEVIVADNASED